MSDSRTNTSKLLSTISSSSGNSEGSRNNISYRDKGLNKILSEAKLFKGKIEALLIIGLRDEPGTETFKKFIKIHLDHAIDNYRRGNFLRPLLENQDDSEKAAIDKEPELKEKIERN